MINLSDKSCKEPDYVRLWSGAIKKDQISLSICFHPVGFIFSPLHFSNNSYPVGSAITFNYPFTA